MKFSRLYALLDDRLAALANPVQALLLLTLRLWWGWSFFLTGKGKLLHLDRTADFFASLAIPLPKLNALMAGSVECTGGLLLLLGLGSRLIAVPLMFTLIVAYATAERDALFSIFSDTDKFTGAAPFLFLLATVTVFAFGPGPLSLDAWLRRRKPAALRTADAATETSAALPR
jgi:putative oxidoreductase